MRERRDDRGGGRRGGGDGGGGRGGGSRMEEELECSFDCFDPTKQKWFLTGVYSLVVHLIIVGTSVPLLVYVLINSQYEEQNVTLVGFALPMMFYVIMYMALTLFECATLTPLAAISHIVGAIFPITLVGMISSHLVRPLVISVYTWFGFTFIYSIFVMVRIGIGEYDMSVVLNYLSVVAQSYSFYNKLSTPRAQHSSNERHATSGNAIRDEDAPQVST